MCTYLKNVKHVKDKVSFIIQLHVFYGFIAIHMYEVKINKKYPFQDCIDM